ncbi:MAG: hypothetical protein P3A28_03240 [Gemmatimonadota bacterium]|nr:hypothetical protein [Gemmatimonadota bacterium]
MRATRLIALAVLLVASAPPIGAQRLFRSTDPVDVTFTTNLRAIIRERDSTRLNTYGAQMTYKDSAGKEVNVPVTLRARGHFRRQQRNCQFPPIRWDAKRADVNNTLFQGLTTLKVTTSCRPGQEEYEQYILGEYSAYRLYQTVSPLHFRTRLARITYKDSAKASPDVTTLAFFIEDDKEMARQNKMQIVETKGALFDDVETTQLMRTTLFEYMVGNTDMSISGLHNIVLLRDSTTLSLNTVAYDFDFTGLVNTRYSSVDPRLRVKRVTDRLHRGPCKTAAEWAPIIAHFQGKKGAIDSVLASIPQLSPARLKSSRDFLDGFWKDMANPGTVKRELVEECQKLGM